MIERTVKAFVFCIGFMGHFASRSLTSFECVYEIIDRFSKFRLLLEQDRNITIALELP